MHRSIRTVRHAAARLAMRPVLGVAALALLGACGRQTAIDTGLNKDLALADQLQRRNAPTLVSTQELSPAVVAPAAVAPAAVAPAPAPVVHTHVATRTVARAAREVAAPTAPATRAVTATVDRSTDGEVVASAPATPAGNGTGRDGSYDAGTSSVGTSAGAEVVAAPSGSTSAPVYRQQAQRHTARDGVVGSIAGAIIGAATSHGDRVRGGLIGAAAGGALGAIYGHSVDRTYAGVQSAYPTYRSYPAYRSTPRYRGTI